MEGPGGSEGGGVAWRRRAALIAAGAAAGFARGWFDGRLVRGDLGLLGWLAADRAVKGGLACGIAASLASRLGSEPGSVRFSTMVALVFSQLANPVAPDTPALYLFSIAWAVYAGVAGGVSGPGIDRLRPPPPPAGVRPPGPGGPA